MPLLREVRPEELLRAGALLGQVAQQVGDCVGQARSAASVSWTGRPNERYQERLADVAQDLGRLQRGYDGACDALLRYARELEPVRALALEADLLEAQCDDLARARVLLPGTAVAAPMDPHEMALRSRAQGLRREAEDAEERASAAVVAALLCLADDAPRTSGWTALSRVVADVAQGASDQVTGTAALAGDALASTPWVGDAASRAAARRRLWAGAAATLQPWLAVEDLLREMREGRWAHAGGGFAAGLVLRRAGARGHKVELFGAHDDLPPDVLRALTRPRDPHLADVEEWVAEREQVRLVEELLRLREVPLPSLDELLGNGVDLLHQEAHGGHTLLKHVGRDPDFLRRRQLAELGSKGPRPMSSFADLNGAEAALSELFSARRAEVVAWLATDEPRAELSLMGSRVQGVVVDAQGDVVPAGEVVVRLVREGGGFRVSTAFVRGR